MINYKVCSGWNNLEHALFPCIVEQLVCSLD